MPAENGQLMAIGAVASHNIANVLGLPEEHVPRIEQAIKDEISAMSSHFTLAVADVQTHFEIELNKIRGTFSFVKANRWKLVGAAAVVFASGVVVGYVL